MPSASKFKGSFPGMLDGPRCPRHGLKIAFARDTNYAHFRGLDAHQRELVGTSRVFGM